MLVRPREVFRAAIVLAVLAILVMRNHPSGDATPSEADIRLTSELLRAGQMLHLKLLDPIIATSSGTDRSGNRVAPPSPLAP